MKLMQRIRQAIGWRSRKLRQVFKSVSKTISEVSNKAKEEEIQVRIREFEDDLGWYQNIDLGNESQRRLRECGERKLTIPVGGLKRLNLIFRTRWKASRF